MKSISINSSCPYKVLIDRDILFHAGEETRTFIKPCKAAIITDDIVHQLYGSTVIASFQKAGYETSSFVFPNGEKSKNLHTYENILNFLAEKNITRSDIVIALGGGVTGDLCGFAASSYLRGIDFIQIPTTYLAAIDSSVGGKTGLNLEAGKNLCGAFYQIGRAHV